MPKSKPGSQAPDVILTSTDGSEVALSDLWTKGLTALTFYRGDFCPTCNHHLHSIEEQAAAFREIGLQVVAISADAPDLERKTVDRHGISFTVLSDPDHRAIDAYGVIYDEAQGHAQPAVFVISPEGQVLYLSITSSPIGRLGADDLLMLGQMIQQQQRAAEQQAA